jgi:hypothetical protein
MTVMTINKGNYVDSLSKFRRMVRSATKNSGCDDFATNWNSQNCDSGHETSKDQKTFEEA